MNTERQFYKIQYYIERNMSWLDVQKRFFNEEEAMNEADDTKQYRLMYIDGKKRTIIDHAVPVS